MPPPMKSYVLHWWRRALEDGKACENKRRERWFTDYFNAAESDLESAGLIPEELRGPFWFLYRRGFRLGYDNARLQRERLAALSKTCKTSKVIRRNSKKTRGF